MLLTERDYSLSILFRGGGAILPPIPPPLSRRIVRWGNQKTNRMKLTETPEETKLIDDLFARAEEELSWGQFITEATSREDALISLRENGSFDILETCCRIRYERCVYLD